MTDFHWFFPFLISGKTLLIQKQEQKSQEIFQCIVHYPYQTEEATLFHLNSVMNKSKIEQQSSGPIVSHVARRISQGKVSTFINIFSDIYSCCPHIRLATVQKET